MFGCPECLDAPICLDTPHICLDAPICFDDVWMPPVHTQHKESMLCQTKEVSICPNTFGCSHMFGYPLYVWISPYVRTSPHMFGCPPYVCISPICLDTPIDLDAPLYVWMPDVHIQVGPT